MAMKKPYEAPRVRKVKLAIKNAVLSVCNSSPTVNMGPGGCALVEICYDSGVHLSRKEGQ